MKEIAFGITTVILSSFLFYLSFHCGKKENVRYALFFILGAGLLLRIFASSDQYLHTWDERYHALVAKHLTEQPLKPTLYQNTVLPFDKTNWLINHVWLEKGPVPLLSMAGAISLFGCNEFAIRIPSIILSLLAVYLTFLIARLLFNSRIALLAAFFHAINGLVIELAAGRVSSDHVETFFIFFVELAILGVVYYLVKKNTLWVAIGIGVSTGLAILSKWFPALLVFPLWMAAAFFIKNIPPRKIIAHIMISGCAMLLVLAPPFLYAYFHYSEEFSFVVKKFLFAYSETVEQHTGSAWFYIHYVGIIFGEAIYLPLILSIIYLFKHKPDWKMVLLTVWWLLPVLLFSFAVTKRYTYLMIAAPAFFIILSTYCWYFYAQLNDAKHKWVYIVIIAALVLLPIRYSFERVKPFIKRDRNPEWSQEIKKIGDNNAITSNTVIFNVDRYIEAMFYCGNTVYRGIPTLKKMEELNELGYSILINDDDGVDSTYRNSSYCKVTYLVTNSSK